MKKPSFVPYEEAVRTNVRRLSGIRRHAARMHALKVLALSLVCVLAGAATVAFGWLNHVSSNMNSSDTITSDLTDSLAKPTGSPTDPFYVLLLGVDRSEERKGSSEYGSSDSNYRSDSMMVVRVAPKDKKLTLVSLHRDTAVDLGEEHGIQKINASYAYGGAAGAVKTVGEFADVPISHYAEVDFDGLVEIVDALGGVEVDVPIDMSDPEYTKIDLKKGRQVVDGHTALMLCRSRHAFDDIGDGDLYRAANQRMVLGAIAKKALSADPATIVSTITALSHCVRTDLGIDQIIDLLLNFQGIDPSTDIMSGFEPTTGAYVNETWYEVVLRDEWQLMMTRVGLGLSPWSDASQDETQGLAGSDDVIENGKDDKIEVTSKAGKNALTESELIARLGGSGSRKSTRSSYSDDDDEDSSYRRSSKASDSTSQSDSSPSDTQTYEQTWSEPEPAAPSDGGYAESSSEPASEPVKEPEPAIVPADPEPSSNSNSGSGSDGGSSEPAIEPADPEPMEEAA